MLNNNNNNNNIRLATLMQHKYTIVIEALYKALPNN